MKIAIVNKFFFLKGGQESVMIEEAKLLEKFGHEAAFFSMHHPLNPPDYKYSKYFIDRVELSDPKREYNFLEKLVIAKNFVYNHKAAKNFEAFINDFKPDIIHCHGISHQLTPSILAIAKIYNVPTVQTLHDYQLICPNYSLLLSGKKICKEHNCSNGNYMHCIVNRCVKNSYFASALSSFEMYLNHQNRRYINYIDKFISPSKFLRKTMIESGISEDKVEYLPNFFNIGDFSHDFSDKSYFLYVGRLSQEKGLMTLLKCFKNLPEANLIIVGTGPTEKKLKKYSDKNNIKNVKFAGYKAGSELEELYKHCTSLILPSEWYENAPMSILEAYAYHKPVIGSNLGGIPEMITEGYNGYLFSPGNVDDLQAKISLFIENKNLSYDLGQNACEYVNRYHSGNDHIEKLINLYKSLITVPYSQQELSSQEQLDTF